MLLDRNSGSPGEWVFSRWGAITAQDGSAVGSLKTHRRWPAGLLAAERASGENWRLFPLAVLRDREANVVGSASCGRLRRLVVWGSDEERVCQITWTMHAHAGETWIGYMHHSELFEDATVVNPAGERLARIRLLSPSKNQWQIEFARELDDQELQMVVGYRWMAQCRRRDLLSKDIRVYT